MSQYVLVLNSGSSSIKFQVIDPSADPSHPPMAAGLVERIGEPKGLIKIKTENQTLEDSRPISSHSVGLERAFALMTGLGLGPLDLDLAAVGHRVVHGGKEFTGPVRITKDVVKQLEDLVPLAPLHNPANIDGIRECMDLLGHLPHVAVFDTSFFSDMPDAAANYAINRELVKEYDIRRYGFHGTSHEFVSKKVPGLLGKDPKDVKQITLHLGNGASATAIDGGVAQDTSMGLTPLAGLVMGTRSGDIDPGILFHLVRSGGLKVDDLDELLNRKSGLKGVCGANDFREILEKIEQGDEDAKLAYGIYIHTLRRFIGSYMLNLGGLDAITFTAGVGENAAAVRRDALAGLENFGIEIDDARNTDPDAEGPREISTDNSSVKVFVVPTNEELAIAQYAFNIAQEAEGS
ncbi:acetate kinase [Corynebacterium sp. 320]|uniref:acetate kinase n=1 Tax=Corynebacterium TaxID=1716 RepID=UPI00125CB9DB|nr:MULTISPECIES: acetate kinase [Corynebacterium]KAB1503087.1 acetate kinase [Corynebacterium sp. 320]KAB1550702.1 acetate kinase [Corynebacterium sp. 321]KAB1551061.1 acetate kinase [Corynebacterium sp. 319]KAB3526884.1 acetate kinase [Corynebacterium sp. 250]KAB3538377.1 acetate kinase [Corynebacterium sp. 366]